MSDIFLSSGQSLNDVTIGDGESVYVGSGAVTSDVQVAPGGYEYVTGGGEAFGTVEAASGVFYVTGSPETPAVVSGGTIETGAEAIITVDGVASSVRVQSGALLSVVGNGSASGSILSSGAFEAIASGASADATDVRSGGTLIVIPGGSGTDTTIEAGGRVVSTGLFFTSFSAASSILAQSVSGMSAVEQPVSGAVIGSGGGVVVLPKGLLIDATFQSGGAGMVYSAGTLSGGVIEAGGSAIIGDNGSATNVTVDNGGWLVLEGNTDVVTIPTGTTLSGITMENGGAIDVPDSTVSASLSGDTVTITSGTSTASVELNGDYDHASLQISGDGDYGTLITLEEGTLCYCRGTLIATENGETPVEALKIGDRVRTASGRFRAVRWIGRRSYSGRFASGNRDVLPVVFRSGSLGTGLPKRDLMVSPLHAMFLENTLIPAVLLVNGVTILQAEAMDEVSYFHVELATHDVLLAEGAPSESFIDDDSRGMFHNAADYHALYPGVARSPAQYCAPRLEEGELLEDIRSRLRARAGMTISSKRDGSPVDGYLDAVTRTTIQGWARASLLDTPVRLRITDNGVTLAEIVADQPRPDVGGPYGFSVTVPGGLSPNDRHVIDVRPVDGDAGLVHSPWVMDLQPEMRQAVSVASPPRGWIDMASRERISGWICNPDDLETPVPIQIVANGRLVARSVANARRPDVARAGQASESCGFDVLLETPLPPHRRHVIEVRREADGVPLRTPLVVEAANRFDPAVALLIRQAVDSTEDARDQARVLSFLLAQTERLKQAHAEQQSGRAASALNKSRARRGLAKAEPSPRRALVIDSRLPDRHRDAGSVAILSHMQALVRLGYAVSLVTADGLAEQSHKIGPGITVLGQPFVSSVEDGLRRQADSFDLVYLHRQEIATTYLPLVRRYQRSARVIYSVADLHHLRLGRQALQEERPELRARALRVRDAEYANARQADVVLTHSGAEATCLRRDLPGVHVHVVPWHVRTQRRVPGFDRRHGVAFIGNFSHAPNVDAAVWLVEGIMPLVRAMAPDVTCFIAGADMPERITRLARQGVAIMGTVPDLRDVLDRVRLTVASLRYGAGIKGKVLESLAHGVPCVMTPIAAEGLDLPDALTGLISDEAAGIAERIVRLHETRKAHNSAVRHGRTYITDHNSEERVDESLRRTLESTSAGGETVRATTAPVLRVAHSR